MGGGILFRVLKRAVSKEPRATRILRGPFRGAVIVLNRRNSLRKIAGLYEHELNAWLEAALRRVSRVVDVGANDGYFTFGCDAAFRRLGGAGEIIAFEPNALHLRTLQASVALARLGTTEITISPLFVGQKVGPNCTTLDAIKWKTGDEADRENALIKIDVEGAEVDVLTGGSSWLNRSNLFLIEVHHECLLGSIKTLFRQRGLSLRQIDQRPLPILGRESRDVANWWLVSTL
jgi:hypothetical protein